MTVCGFLVQRRRQRCSQGQGQKGKESEVKKASHVISNRAFPVGKKASFNYVCSSGGCNDISRVFSVPGRSGVLSTPASSCLDSDRSSSAAGVMDPGDFEGNFVSELVKVAPATTGSASQVRRVCDSAVCGFVSAPDTASGTDLLRPGAGFFLRLQLMLLQVLGRTIRRMQCPSADYVGVLLRILQVWFCIPLQMKVRESLDCLR